MIGSGVVLDPLSLHVRCMVIEGCLRYYCTTFWNFGNGGSSTLYLFGFLNILFCASLMSYTGVTHQGIALTYAGRGQKQCTLPIC